MRNKNSETITLKDIAQSTGYTINTVSRALNDKDDISEPTKELIRDAARKMGYLHNTLASSLRTGKTKTIAFIVGDISNPHFSILAKEVENKVRQYGYCSFMINTEEDEGLEKEAIDLALSRKVDGIIICPTQKSRKNIEYLKSMDICFVLMGRYYEDMDTDYVVCDDVDGGYIAAKHLLDKGHRKILLLNGPGHISSARERKEGYIKALDEFGVKYNEDMAVEVPISAGVSLEALQKRIRNAADFTAVFAFSDVIAWEAISMLNCIGFKVPEDISVVGYDDIQSAIPFPCPLTSVGTKNRRMSDASVEALMSRISGREPKHIKEKLAVEITGRSSVAAI